MTVLAIASDVGSPAACGYPALLEAHADAVAAYNWAVRQGFTQPVRLRAAETIRRAERAIGQMLREQPGLLPPTDFAACLAMAVGTDTEFEDAIQAAYEEHNLARVVITRHLGEPEHGAEWIPDPGDRSTAARNRRRVLIRQLAATGRSPRRIARLIGTTEARVTQFLNTQEA